MSSCQEKRIKDYMLNFTFDPCLYREEPTSYVEELKQEDEVFHLSNQDYTYKQAQCKCSAYGARLATKEEITKHITKVLVGAHMDGQRDKMLTINTKM